MPKRIPIAEAKRVAEAQGCKQIVILAWDGSLVHIVTYGIDKEQCAHAAKSGNALNKWLNSKYPVKLDMFNE